MGTRTARFPKRAGVMPILENQGRRNGTKQHARITNFVAATEKIAFSFIRELTNGSCFHYRPAKVFPAEVAPRLKRDVVYRIGSPASISQTPTIDLLPRGVNTTGALLGMTKRFVWRVWQPSKFGKELAHRMADSGLEGVRK
jgi:hypothetical protein